MTPEISLGRHFASQYLEHTEYVEEHNLSQGINISEMAGVMLFDCIFHNTDRANNKNNLLIRQEQEGYKLYAIDNSHLFRSGKWTLESLKILSPRIKPYCRNFYGTLLRDYLSAHDFLPYLEKVMTISNEAIETIVGQIPPEWLPDQFEKKELAHYIQIRRDMAEDIRDTLCKYIPIARGGNRWLYRRGTTSHHGDHLGKS